MLAISKIFLVDGDVRRRAAITHWLSQHALHVEPYERAAELRGQVPDRGLVLVHDDADAIVVAIDCLREAGTWLPVVGFSEQPAPRAVAKAIHQGAVDYLRWPIEEDELAGMIEDAAAAAKTIGDRRSREFSAKKRIDRLSKREREVLLAVANGFSSHKIAEKLDISPRTVEIHRSNMLHKMGATNTSEAIRLAVEANATATATATA